MKLLLRILTIIATSLCFLVVANISQAHHSVGAFDVTTEVTLEGVINTFEWTNPHVWLWLDVKSTDDSNTVTTWGLEGMSPNFIRRRGWTKNSLKPGDHIKVLAFPLKNGEPGGILLRVTDRDGIEKVMWDRRAQK
jgi:hypothetical protein